MSYLLDTDTCSMHLKDERRLFHKMMQYSGRLYVSRITIAELCVWVCRADPSNQQARRDRIDRLLEDLEVVEVDEVVCRKYGELQWDRIKRGTRGPGMDMLIASCALANELTMVTGNVRDFSGIPGLNVENWLTP